MTNNKTYALNVGTLECLIMNDGHKIAQPDGLAGMCLDVPLSEVQAAAEVVLQNGWRLENGFNCVYIKSGDRHLLLDVGLRSEGNESFGHLLDAFKFAEITSETIDTLIFSHAHNDHIDGAIDDDGNLNFPNANYLMAQSEWDYWHGDEPAKLFGEEYPISIRQTLAHFEDKMTLFDSEIEIVPGVRVIALPGHTPGHIGLMLESEGERLLCVSDVIHLLFQLKHPKWGLSVDSDPKTTIETRLAILEKAATEELLILGMHIPFPGIGHVIKEDEAFTWQPVDL